MVDIYLTCFHYFSSDYHFVKDLVHFVEVEDKVEFTYTSKILIKNFNKQMNEFKVAEFVVILVHA